MVAYQTFISLLANSFNKNCMRIKFQSILSSRKQTCINCETQNPHSRLNCGRISVTQVAQETQRGYLPEFHLSSCDNFTPNNALEISPKLYFRRNKLASAAVETLNPHSRLNCGRISAIQVPQEAQRGLPTRIFFETRTKTRRRSEYNPRKVCRGDVAGRWRRASYAP